MNAPLHPLLHTLHYLISIHRVLTHMVEIDVTRYGEDWPEYKLAVPEADAQDFLDSVTRQFEFDGPVFISGHL